MRFISEKLGNIELEEEQLYSSSYDYENNFHQKQKRFA